MGIKIGYARVSTTGQSVEVQVEALKRAGCDRIYEEQKSGTTRKGREELERALNDIREGDTFVVTRIDRLARGIRDLKDIVERIETSGGTFEATEQSIETQTAAGRCFLSMLGVFAEFETELRRERQMEGINKAKKKGVYKGRKASIDPKEVKQLLVDGLSAAKVAQQLNISRSSVYRLLDDTTDTPVRRRYQRSGAFVDRGPNDAEYKKILRDIDDSAMGEIDD